MMVLLITLSKWWKQSGIETTGFLIINSQIPDLVLHVTGDLKKQGVVSFSFWMPMTFLKRKNLRFNLTCFQKIRVLMLSMEVYAIFPMTPMTPQTGYLHTGGQTRNGCPGTQAMAILFCKR